MAYAKNGDFENAKSSFERFEKIIPNANQAYYNWAIYYALLNQPEIALKYLQKAINSGFTNYEWIKFDENLENLHTHSDFQKILETIQSKKEER